MALTLFIDSHDILIYMKHATTKSTNLEKQNKEFKLTIKDMDRRIMRGLKE